MAETHDGLVAVCEATFDTDFKIIGACQPDAEFIANTNFATSSPGSLTMGAGSKYASVRLRLERWSSEPPWQPGWEDREDLPFSEHPEGGLLMPHGFDPPRGDVGLDITGLGRAIARVLARGRYDAPDGLGISAPPEEWLVQLFPDPVPGGHDPLTAEPRRLAIDPTAALLSAYTPWRHVHDAWETSGWAVVLGQVAGFYDLGRFVLRAGRPATLATLLDSDPQRRGFSPSGPLPPTRREGQGERRAAELAAMDRLATWEDLTECLVRLGLLIRVHGPGEPMLALSAPTTPAWEHPLLDEVERRHIRRGALRFSTFDAGDIRSLVRWCTSPVVTTPRQLAIRTGIAPTRVLNALALLELHEDIRFSVPAGGLTLETEFSIAV